MIVWTLNALRPCAIVALEFFGGETLVGLSTITSKLRLALLGTLLTIIFVLIQSVVQYPKASARETGEEQLVMQGEFKSAQERNKEVQTDLRENVTRLWASIYEIRERQARNEEFHRRIEEKFDTGVKILWAMASLLILQVIVPLARLMLGREILRARKEDHYAGRVDKP